MKRVEIKNEFGTTTTYATNSVGEGAFVLKTDGTYYQSAGTAQTPVFKSPIELLRWFSQENAEIVSQFGWEG